jgi:hypothetical protein
MRNENLLPFYFGAIDDNERLKFEQQMLVDPEVLLDYLDLKRRIEGAAAVPQKPSPALWNRLVPKVRLSRKSKITLALGFAVAMAASIVVAFLILQKTASIDSSTSAGIQGHSILFDSDSEQFAHSNVL